MAAFAYLLLPLSGIVAYFRGRDARVRFHGLQAIFFGALWPASLWLCSFVTAGAVQIAFVAGVAVWIALLVAALAGRDLHLPLVGRSLERIAEVPPTGAP